MSAPPAPPVISVLMAVHNGRPFLAHAVESILNQTLTNFEFIIVDDGSTDGSTELLQTYSSQDSRIQLVIQDQQGLTKSLNNGLALARAELIARMDADDVAYVHRLECQHRFAIHHPDVVAFGSRARYVTDTGRPLFVRTLPLTHEAILECHLAGVGGFIIHPTAMIRKDALLAVGGYNESFILAQDYELWCRLYLSGELANIPEVLLDYRYHDTAVSQSLRTAQNETCLEILHELQKSVGLSSPVPLKRDYQIFPQDLDWLFFKSAKDGFASTAWRAGTKLLLDLSKQGARVAYWMLRSLFKFSR
jgi:glycosyltransferase involved in cell wall biosynthesis